MKVSGEFVVELVMKVVVIMGVREVVNTCILFRMMVLKLMVRMMMKQSWRVVVGKVEQ